MKKFGILALVLILVLSLAACGKRNKDQSEPTGTENNTQTDPAATVTDPTVTMPTVIDPTIMDPLPETNIPDPNVDTSMPEVNTTAPSR